MCVCKLTQSCIRVDVRLCIYIYIYMCVCAYNIANHLLLLYMFFLLFYLCLIELDPQEYISVNYQSSYEESIPWLSISNVNAKCRSHVKTLMHYPISSHIGMTLPEREFLLWLGWHLYTEIVPWKPLSSINFRVALPTKVTSRARISGGTFIHCQIHQLNAGDPVWQHPHNKKISLPPNI